MEVLSSDALHDYLRTAAAEHRLVSVHDVAKAFGVAVGTVRKRFGLLTGKMVLVESSKGRFDCTGVLRCSQKAFASAGSQGKGNQEYVSSLLREIERLKGRSLATQQHS